jgi:hypothetical protein
VKWALDISKTKLGFDGVWVLRRCADTCALCFTCNSNNIVSKQELVVAMVYMEHKSIALSTGIFTSIISHMQSYPHHLQTYSKA